MKINRVKDSPIIKTYDIIPSSLDMKVDGVFNAGVTLYNNETLLILRVAESVVSQNETELKIPILKGNKLEVITLDKNKDKDRYDFSDKRCIWEEEGGRRKIAYLTSISHFRRARSKDGINFIIDEKPWIYPEGQYETWGIEDSRITQIDGTFYINYTAVSEKGACTALITTQDFESFERKAIIFSPENKDVTIFPEKINGSYYALNRPVTYAIGNPDIWLAKSPDLLHWGEQIHLLGIGSEMERWDNGRIGAGAVPFKTDKGYLEIYHAADKDNRYCLGALLLDEKDPGKILAISKKPILSPEADYEVNGFFGNVVFTCGLIYYEDKGEVWIYYGCADETMGLAIMSIEDIFKELETV